MCICLIVYEEESNRVIKVRFRCAAENMSAPKSVQCFMNRALPLELEMRVEEEDVDDPDEVESKSYDEDFDDSQEEVMPVPVEVTITPYGEDFRVKQEGRDSVDLTTLHEEVDIKEEEEEDGEVLQPPLEVNIKAEPREEEELVEETTCETSCGSENDPEEKTAPAFSSVVDGGEDHNSEEEILPHAAMVVVPGHTSEYPEDFVEENVVVKPALRTVKRQKLSSKRDGSSLNTVDTIYSCKYCSMCYTSEDYLQQHVQRSCRSRVNFGRVDTVYRCPNCSLCYTSPEYLAGHVRRGCRYRPSPIKNAYLCIICGDGFNNYGDLYQHKRQKHVNNHTSGAESVPATNTKVVKYPQQTPRAFKCPNCPRTFTAPGYLVQHQRSHVRQQTDHSCDLCGADFRQKPRREVEEHFEEQHPSKEMHRCTHCDRVYGQRQNLVTHLQTHGEFECFVCNQQFACQQLLTEHFRTHAVNQPLECNICHKIYWQQGRYYEHRRKTHNIIEKPTSSKSGNSSVHINEKGTSGGGGGGGGGGGDDDDDDDDDVQVVSVIKTYASKK